MGKVSARACGPRGLRLGAGLLPCFSWDPHPPQILPELAGVWGEGHTQGMTWGRVAGLVPDLEAWAHVVASGRGWDRPGTALGDLENSGLRFLF